MKNAIDFSFARPSPQDIAAHGFDVLVYTGPARPDAGYIATCRSLGIGVTLIQESDPNRAQQGYQAGVNDAHYADSRADEVGYPSNCSIAYVVSDGSAGDPNYGAGNIAEYARAIRDTSRRPYFWYGNTYACNAALAGGGGLGTWIPSTWGSGSLLVQEANIASPIPDTDLNTVRAPYGAWGGAEVPQEDDDVKALYITKRSDPNLGIWVTTGIHKRHVLPDEWAFIQFTQPGTGVVGLSDQWWDSIPSVTPDSWLTVKDLQNVQNAVKAIIPPSSGGGTAPSTFNIALTGQAKAA